ncbi:hypothetical protein BHM03_00058190, partial [Ensete ventricosum]
DALALFLYPHCAAIALHKQRRCTSLAWAVTPVASVVALRRHLAGGRRRLVRALPLQAAALAIGLPLAASQRALPTPAGVTPASTNYARGQSCLLAATPARGFGHGRPPL